MESGDNLVVCGSIISRNRLENLQSLGHLFHFWFTVTSLICSSLILRCVSQYSIGRLIIRVVSTEVDHKIFVLLGTYADQLTINFIPGFISEEKNLSSP